MCFFSNMKKNYPDFDFSKGHYGSDFRLNTILNTVIKIRVFKHLKPCNYLVYVFSEHYLEHRNKNYSVHVISYYYWLYTFLNTETLYFFIGRVGRKKYKECEEKNENEI